MRLLALVLGLFVLFGGLVMLAWAIVILGEALRGG